MESSINIKEIRPINIEGGYVLDGFPSIGFSNAIATESMIQIAHFELAATLDSEFFPPISIIKDGIPNYPANIFVNDQLKISVFSSYLVLDESLHRVAAKTMLDWAKKQKCSLILSSVPITETQKFGDGIMGVASTEHAKNILKKAGIPILSSGTIPGLPGMLLNEGRFAKQNVVVLLFQIEREGPDFKSGVKLCTIMSKLVPGVSCSLTLLEKQAEIAEYAIKEIDTKTKSLRDSIYS
ncbi:MAG TPA: PAC2 family protein [Nitrosarchaeum sp.]